MAREKKVELTGFVALALESACTDGYVTSTQAKKDTTKTSTGDVAWDRALGGQAAAAFYAALADRAMEWAQGRWGTWDSRYADFDETMYDLVNGGAVTLYKRGYAAYIAGGYLKSVSKQAARVEADGASEYIGTVGKRGEWTLTVTAVKRFETAGYGYGDTGSRTMYVFKDTAGNVAKWFTSALLRTGDGWDASEVAVGDVITAKATVKKHSEYQGIKETTLTRVALTDVVSLAGDAAAA